MKISSLESLESFVPQRTLVLQKMYLIHFYPLKRGHALTGPRMAQDRVEYLKVGRHTLVCQTLSGGL